MIWRFQPILILLNDTIKYVGPSLLTIIYVREFDF